MNAQVTLLPMSMEISVKKDGKHVKVGDVSYMLPLLSAFGLTHEQATDDKGAALFEDGIPVYKDEAANWLQSAVAAYIKVQVRNRIDNKTAKPKAGCAVPMTMQEILAVSERAGNGAALQIITQAKKDFAAWVASLGKSEKARILLNTIFGNKDSLRVQDATNKAKMAGYLADFAESLDANKLAAYQRYIESLLEICQQTDDEEDANDF